MEKAIQEKSLLTVWFKDASGTLWYMMADTGTRVQMPFFMMLFFFPEDSLVSKSLLHLLPSPPH